MDQALPILDRLKPLETSADLERTEASRAIVRGRLEQLPIELGLDGGPRAARVDDIFRILLDFDPTATPGGEIPVRGEIGRLGERFGFDADNVNTVEEEEALTDFQVLADYVISLATSWARVRRTFDRGDADRDRFLGTQLVILSRSLAITAETVEEARRALRSVFIGDAEAELIDVHVRDAPPLSLAEGLRWTEEVATVEGPKLVNDAGKEGVAALEPTLRRLSKFARAAARQRDVGRRDPRVRRAFLDLGQALRRAARATTGITPERHTIAEVKPLVRERALLGLDIVGTNLELPADVVLLSGRASWGADSVGVDDDGTHMVASFDPPVTLVSDTYTVTVEIDGDVEEHEFTVLTPDTED